MDQQAPMSNDEILEMMLSMGDMGAEGMELKRQQALSQSLRSQARPSRMDFGSQAARALGGVEEGMQAGRERDAMAKYRSASDRNAALIGDILRRRYGGGGTRLPQLNYGPSAAGQSTLGSYGDEF